MSATAPVGNGTNPVAPLTPLAPADISALATTRARHPEAIAEAAARRTRRPLLGDSGRLMIVAADHPARGALGVGNRKLAMANRADLLERLCLALSAPVSTVSSRPPTSWTTCSSSVRSTARSSWGR